MGDPDPAESIRTRELVPGLPGEPSVTGFGIHFADVVSGAIRRDGHGRTWAQPA